jgi:MFS family permease
MLIAFRALQGFTDAMMFGPSIAIVTSVYPTELRGRALGVTVASVYTGSARCCAGIFSSLSRGNVRA